MKKSKKNATVYGAHSIKPKPTAMTKPLSAVVATIAGGALCGLTFAQTAAIPPANAAPQSTSAGTQSSQAEATSGALAYEDATAPSEKKEDVYIFANADGSVKSTTVSAKLSNPTGASMLKDQSNLTGITNVEGDGEYSENAEGLVWDAQGSDVYYQGETKAEAPVTMKVTYTLDGEEIAPDQLAGKSGEVTIRYDYTNNSKETRSVGGETRTMYTPFVAMTAVLLDNDHFSNVKVDNGKLMDDGDRTIIAGYALPGMAEDLDVDSADLDIPESVTITADATDFQLDTTMTIVTSDLLNDVDSSDFSMGDIHGDLNAMADAMSQLLDGSNALKDGLTQLDAGAGALVDGVDLLKNGGKQLSEGTSKLADGSAQVSGALNTLSGNNDALNQGASDLNDGLSQLANNSSALNSGASSLSSNLTTYTQGVAGAATGAQGLQQGLSTYTGGVDQAAASATALQQGLQDKATEYEGNAQAAQGAVASATADLTSAMTQLKTDIATGADAATLNADADAVSAASQALAQASGTAGGAQGAAQALSSAASNDGLNTIVSGLGTLSGQSQTLNNGASQLATGLGTLKDNNDALTGGASALESGISSYTGGVSQAQQGASQLNGGISQYTQGVSTLTQSYGTLNTGIAQANAGAQQLSGGLAQLQSQAPALVSGVQQLAAGSGQLSDGLQQFNDQAVQKIISLYNDNIKGLADRVDTTVDMGQKYSNFTGISDGTSGKVSFIYETDGIGVD